MAPELRGRRITVNAVAPGPVGTDLFYRGKTEAQVGVRHISWLIFIRLFIRRAWKNQPVWLLSGEVQLVWSIGFNPRLFDLVGRNLLTPVRIPSRVPVSRSLTRFGQDQGIFHG